MQPSTSMRKLDKILIVCILTIAGVVCYLVTREHSHSIVFSASVASSHNVITVTPSAVLPPDTAHASQSKPVDSTDKRRNTKSESTDFDSSRALVAVGITVSSSEHDRLETGVIDHSGYAEAQLAFERRESESALEWQTRIWKEGIQAGERYKLAGKLPVNGEISSHGADDIYPRNLTAYILWTIGFEQGQITASK